jgi:transketolase
MRRLFSDILYNKMKTNDKIWLIAVDLGYKMFDDIFRDFPERTLNPGAAEQAAMGIAVGLAQENKIPFVYSITPFLLFRAAETLRNYVNYESANVKLIGSGRNGDYLHDGQSHWAFDAGNILKCFPNIEQLWPETKEEIPDMLDEMLKVNSPYFLSLTR